MRPRLRLVVSRVLWFAALWAAGVTAVALVAYGIRWWLASA